MYISWWNFYTLLNLPRSSCAKCNYRPSGNNRNSRPCDSGAALFYGSIRKHIFSSYSMCVENNNTVTKRTVCLHDFKNIRGRQAGIIPIISENFIIISGKCHQVQLRIFGRASLWECYAFLVVFTPNKCARKYLVTSFSHCDVLTLIFDILYLHISSQFVYTSSLLENIKLS